MLARAGKISAPCPIRAITAGVPLRDLRHLRPIEDALGFLKRARHVFESEGYEVQTVRLATSSWLSGDARERERALSSLYALDELLREHRISASIGQCSATAVQDAELAEWIAHLLATTERLYCSVSSSAAVAAATMVALAQRTPGGEGLFRFAAAAGVPPGTPFFPVAYHEGPAGFSIGLEAAALIEESSGLREVLNAALAPVERIARHFAAREGRKYLGIDASPAPGLDRSIGSAIEKLTGHAFGAAGTLAACATITAALRSLEVQTCGYSGLMLPVLEDRVLAQRASEGRFGLRDLLLFSSVCGTGLDVVPIPGDTPVELIERIIRDTEALAARWSKALSVRLLMIPGKQAGEPVTFANPELTACRVMAV